MNAKYRFFYLFAGFVGLGYLVYHAIATYADGINPGSILVISLTDMVFFFLAYKTYPSETA